MTLKTRRNMATSEWQPSWLRPPPVPLVSLTWPASVPSPGPSSPAGNERPALVCQTFIQHHYKTSTLICHTDHEEWEQSVYEYCYFMHKLNKVHSGMETCQTKPAGRRVRPTSPKVFSVAQFSLSWLQKIPGLFRTPEA